MAVTGLTRQGSVDTSTANADAALQYTMLLGALQSGSLPQVLEALRKPLEGSGLLTQATAAARQGDARAMLGAAVPAIAAGPYTPEQVNQAQRTALAQLGPAAGLSAQTITRAQAARGDARLALVADATATRTAATAAASASGRERARAAEQAIAQGLMGVVVVPETAPEIARARADFATTKANMVQKFGDFAGMKDKAQAAESEGAGAHNWFMASRAQNNVRLFEKVLEAGERLAKPGATAADAAAYQDARAAYDKAMRNQPNYVAGATGDLAIPEARVLGGDIDHVRADFAARSAQVAKLGGFDKLKDDVDNAYAQAMGEHRGFMFGNQAGQRERVELLRAVLVAGERCQSPAATAADVAAYQAAVAKYDAAAAGKKDYVAGVAAENIDAQSAIINAWAFNTDFDAARTDYAARSTAAAKQGGFESIVRDLQRDGDPYSDRGFGIFNRGTAKKEAELLAALWATGERVASPLATLDDLAAYRKAQQAYDDHAKAPRLGRNTTYLAGTGG